ncbi:hypothetical protein EDD22DRAFT_849095 [Suillus occidentalis]|nr:hypothetical protein EDD22DRAFT_849095 [Suillus occidentalis]
MDNLQAGIYRPHDTAVIYICDCDVCLRKNCRKPKQVKCTTYYEHQPGRLAKHNALPPSMPPIPQILVASEPLTVPELSSSKRPSPSETDEPSSGSKKSCTEEMSGPSDIVPLLEPLDPQTKVSSAKSSHMPHDEDNGMADREDDTFDAAGHDFRGADFGQGNMTFPV